jgi:hypothetical protein
LFRPFLGRFVTTDRALIQAAAWAQVPTLNPSDND